jgi:rSAM/selenodomain-associated transferase 1
MTNALLVVAKRPAAGQTKTRLSPPFSLLEAASLYEQFLQDTLDLIRQVPGVQPIIAYLPAEEEAYFCTLAPDVVLLPQQGADLGARLDNALTYCLQNGFQKAVIMDSDSPTLPVAYVVEAFAALDQADIVLGPCEDGGYYLIGLKRPAPRLLREVTMSTPYVIRDTLKLASEEGLTVAQLPLWYDVDTVAELHRLWLEIETMAADRANHTRLFLRGTSGEPKQ